MRCVIEPDGTEYLIDDSGKRHEPPPRFLDPNPPSRTSNPCPLPHAEPEPSQPNQSRGSTRR